VNVLDIPKLIKVRQHFNTECITDIEGVVKHQIFQKNISICAGSSIAVAVGSRGIANIARIVKAAVDTLKEMGANPFIVPAMGSHGGATAAGQKEVLESYVPIKSTMQTVELPDGDPDLRAYMDKYAYESDGVIVINRIKPHTDFHGTIESGMLKMCVIGLGKHRQAMHIHKYGVYGLKELMPLTAKKILKSGKILMGIGIVENAYDQTMIIKAVAPSEMEEEEIKLLEISRINMPCLPVNQIDALIVDEIGKNISGTGMDPNIIGRTKIRGEQEPLVPDITSIIAADLTEASHGNALGVGLADFITKRLFNKIDFKATYENTLTSTFIERGKIPIVADTDREAVEYAMRTCRRLETDRTRIIRIKNTLKLGEIYVSEPILNELKTHGNSEILGSFTDVFDNEGNLVDF
jgi:hypothetical protein